MDYLLRVIVDDPRFHELGYKIERATADSAGFDLRAMFEGDGPLIIPPRTSVLIPSGLRVWLQNPNAVGMIFPRSGTGHKRGIVLGNGTGVIDADYQGKLMISTLNRTDEPIEIELGERIAQYVVLPVLRPWISVVDSFDQETERGSGGFGSSGTK